MVWKQQCDIYCFSCYGEFFRFSCLFEQPATTEQHQHLAGIVFRIVYFGSLLVSTNSYVALQQLNAAQCLPNSCYLCLSVVEQIYLSCWGGGKLLPAVVGKTLMETVKVIQNKAVDLKAKTMSSKTLKRPLKLERTVKTSVDSLLVCHFKQLLLHYTFIRPIVDMKTFITAALNCAHPKHLFVK